MLRIYLRSFQFFPLKVFLSVIYSCISCHSSWSAQSLYFLLIPYTYSSASCYLFLHKRRECPLTWYYFFWAIFSHRRSGPALQARGLSLSVISFDKLALWHEWIDLRYLIGWYERLWNHQMCTNHYNHLWFRLNSGHHMHCLDALLLLWAHISSHLSKNLQHILSYRDFQERKIFSWALFTCWTYFICSEVYQH